MTPARVAAAGAGWLAAFALAFSAGSALGVWPAPPEGFLHGSDLAAGFAFGVVLLAAFLRPPRGMSLG